MKKLKLILPIGLALFSLNIVQANQSPQDLMTAIESQQTRLNELQSQIVELKDQLKPGSRSTRSQFKSEPRTNKDRVNPINDNFTMPERCKIDYLNEQIQFMRLHDEKKGNPLVYRVKPYLTKECEAVFDLNFPDQRAVHNNDYNWYLESELKNGIPPATWILLKK